MEQTDSSPTASNNNQKLTMPPQSNALAITGTGDGTLVDPAAGMSMEFATSVVSQMDAKQFMASLLMMCASNTSLAQNLCRTVTAFQAATNSRFDRVDDELTEVRSISTETKTTVEKIDTKVSNLGGTVADLGGAVDVIQEDVISLKEQNLRNQQQLNEILARQSQGQSGLSQHTLKTQLIETGANYILPALWAAGSFCITQEYLVEGARTETVLAGDFDTVIPSGLMDFALFGFKGQTNKDGYNSPYSVHLLWHVYERYTQEYGEQGVPEDLSVDMDFKKVAGMESDFVLDETVKVDDMMAALKGYYTRHPIRAPPDPTKPSVRKTRSLLPDNRFPRVVPCPSLIPVILAGRSAKGYYGGAWSHQFVSKAFAALETKYIKELGENKIKSLLLSLDIIKENGVTFATEGINPSVHKYFTFTSSTYFNTPDLPKRKLYTVNMERLLTCLILCYQTLSPKNNILSPKTAGLPMIIYIIFGYKNWNQQFDIHPFLKDYINGVFNYDTIATLQTTQMVREDRLFRNEPIAAGEKSLLERISLLDKFLATYRLKSVLPDTNLNNWPRPSYCKLIDFSIANGLIPENQNFHDTMEFGQRSSGGMASNDAPFMGGFNINEVHSDAVGEDEDIDYGEEYQYMLSNGDDGGSSSSGFHPNPVYNFNTSTAMSQAAARISRPVATPASASAGSGSKKRAMPSDADQGYLQPRRKKQKTSHK